MVIAGITYFPYQLTLKTPLKNSKNIIRERKGYIIEISDVEGNTGIGEAAPLPEFGSETLDESLDSILRFISEYPEEINGIIEASSLLKHYIKTPAARHGIEQALFNVITNAGNESLPQLLNRKYQTFVKVNSLIGFVQPDQCSNLALRMVNEGFDTIKLKMGRQHFQNDLDAITAVRDAVGNKINIRIDVNGKWEFDEAVRNIKVLEKFSPEYIEQPVSSKKDLVKLSSASDLKIAADESLRSIYEINEFIDKRICEVLVLKPMMTGGITVTLEAIKKAETNNIKTIISSSFESAVGFRTNVLLASLIRDEYAHGLSAPEFFATNLYENPFTVNQGEIIIDEPFNFSRI